MGKRWKRERASCPEPVTCQSSIPFLLLCVCSIQHSTSGVPYILYVPSIVKIQLDDEREKRDGRSSDWFRSSVCLCAHVSLLVANRACCLDGRERRIHPQRVERRGKKEEIERAEQSGELTRYIYLYRSRAQSTYNTRSARDGGYPVPSGARHHSCSSLGRIKMRTNVKNTLIRTDIILFSYCKSFLISISIL